MRMPLRCNDVDIVPPDRIVDYNFFDGIFMASWYCGLPGEYPIYLSAYPKILLSAYGDIL